MSRHAWSLALLLSGCSLIFDPNKAPPPPCPTSPDRCPPEPFAVAFCQGTRCGYTCAIGHVDDDGDLGSGPSSNGCETPCDACAPAPAYLEAVVGPTSQTIQALWPDLDSGTAEDARVITYRVYSGSSPSPLAPLLDVARSSCDAGICSTDISKLQNGVPLANNTRLYLQLRSVDIYGNESDAGSAPNTSATPINGTGSSTQDWNLVNACGGFTADGGIFEMDTNLVCITTAYVGDGAWSDYTFDLEVQIHPAAFGANDVTGGPILWGDAGLPQAPITAITLPCLGSQDAPAGFHDNFAFLSGGVGCAPLASWFHTRLVTLGGLASLQVGPTTGPLQELVRWRQTDQPAIGNVGLAATTLGLGGSVQFRNLRLSTRPQMPPSGPASLHLDFASNSSVALRATGDAGTLDAGPCPALPGATGCDAGECPLAGAGCLFLSTGSVGEQAVAFDLPLGLDPASGYEVRFSFAAVGDAGHLQILRSPEGDVLASDAGGALALFGQPRQLGIQVGVWNAVDLVVDPDAGRATFQWNGISGGTVPISTDGGTFDLSPLILGPSSTGGPMTGVYGPVDITAR